jgi:hypothetical protein
MSMSIDEWKEKLRADVKRYIPMKRLDDRWLPGIIIGWAVNFDESVLRWRVWNGLIDRMDHPTKDPIYGYHPHPCGDGSWEDACGAVLIKYPEYKPQVAEVFIAWANEQYDLHYPFDVESIQPNL